MHKTDLDNISNFIIIKVAAFKEVEAWETIHINLYSGLSIEPEVNLIEEHNIDENTDQILRKFPKTFSYKVLFESTDVSSPILECLMNQWPNKIKYDTQIVGITK